MPVSQKIGSARPLTFIVTGKPMRPTRPQPPNRQPGLKGISYSGKVSFREFRQNNLNNAQLSPTQIGQGAVRLQKFSGISVNVTI
ncbi:hypothetical protein ACFL6L_02375 [candidate division KSB1 bacterium]